MRKLFIWFFLGLFVCVSGTTAYAYYLLFHKDAVGVKKSVQIRLYRSMTIDEALDFVISKAQICHPKGFKKLAVYRGFNKVTHGFITIDPGMSLMEITAKLRSLKFQNINITIIGGWGKKELIKAISKQLEIDESFFKQFLTSNEMLKKWNLDTLNWHALFIPNTYEFSSNTALFSESPKGFLQLMNQHRLQFWNANRRALLDSQKLTEWQVINLASIISKESNKPDEYINIAGVYINRLRKNMLLQADPTVVYARGYSGRVYLKDLKIPSPYNTYLNAGLPPGPICIPNLSAIESVLNYRSHSYLYFCASPDFSGYHRFASNLTSHLKNAQAYHKALDSLKRVYSIKKAASK